MREDIEKAFGQVDILVNCAGGDIGASGNKPEPNNILGITYEDLITLTNNNLIGTMLVTQAFVPQMVERQSGIVVNIGSTAAHLGLSHGGIYATLKAGVVAYTRCLAAEVREDGVRVNAVSPGPSKTARFQATRTVDPVKMDSIRRLVRPLRRARGDRRRRRVPLQPGRKVHARPGAPRRRRADALSGLTGQPPRTEEGDCAL